MRTFCSVPFPPFPIIPSPLLLLCSSSFPKCPLSSSLLFSSHLLCLFSLESNQHLALSLPCSKQFLNCFYTKCLLHEAANNLSTQSSFQMYQATFITINCFPCRPKTTPTAFYNQRRFHKQPFNSMQFLYWKSHIYPREVAHQEPFSNKPGLCEKPSTPSSVCTKPLLHDFYTTFQRHANSWWHV